MQQPQVSNSIVVDYIFHIGCYLFNLFSMQHSKTAQLFCFPRFVDIISVTARDSAQHPIFFAARTRCSRMGTSDGSNGESILRSFQPDLYNLKSLSRSGRWFDHMYLISLSSDLLWGENMWFGAVPSLQALADFILRSASLTYAEEKARRGACVRQAVTEQGAGFGL